MRAEIRKLSIIGKSVQVQDIVMQLPVKIQQKGIYDIGGFCELIAKMELSIAIVLLIIVQTIMIMTIWIILN